MAEPVSLATAKQHLRVFDNGENSLIEVYIRAARDWVENYTGHIISPRSFTTRFNAWGDYLVLYRQPVTAIAITYDSADDDQTPFTDFEWSLGQHPMRIHPSGAFPILRTNGYITVTYTAGHTTVPDALVQATLLMIGHFYTARSAVGPDALDEVPLAVRSLCTAYRGAVMA
jgi:uncharacterized phiE125 gp8 family phage protein